MSSDCHQQWPRREGRLEFAARLAQLLESSPDEATSLALEEVLAAVRADVPPPLSSMARVLVYATMVACPPRAAVPAQEEVPPEVRPAPPHGRRARVPAGGLRNVRSATRSAPDRPRSVFADRIREEDDLTDTPGSRIARKLGVPRSSVQVDGAGKRRIRSDDD